MRTKSITQLALVILLTGCAAIQKGSDPVVVNAERTTQLALNTFNMIEKTEYDVYPAVKAADPKLAANIRNFVNNLRVHEHEWLSSARSMTVAYKNNRTATNKANLQTAVAVLQSAVAESTKYLSEIDKQAKGTP